MQTFPFYFICWLLFLFLSFYFVWFKYNHTDKASFPLATLKQVVYYLFSYNIHLQLVKLLMPAFHRKHSSGASKNPPVLLSSERPSPLNVGSEVAAQAENATEKLQSRVQNATEQVQEQIRAPEKEKAIPLKTFDHIKSYPLVQETRSFLYEVPAARIVHANTKPWLKSILESKLMQIALPVTNTVDTVANSSLNLTEKIVPSLKTKTYQKLSQEALLPYTYTKKYGKQATDKTVSLVDQNVYRPTHNQVLKFRKYYNEKIYDTKGKPLVRSSLDPITAPLNNFFQNNYVKWLPEGKDVPRDGYSSELNRSVALVINFFSRSIPVLEKNVIDTGMMPCYYFIHANKVLNKSLDKQPSLGFKNSLNGSKDAISHLEKEAADYIKSHGPQKLLTNPLHKGNKKNRVEDVVEQSQNAIQDHVEEIQSHV